MKLYSHSVVFGPLVLPKIFLLDFTAAAAAVA